MKRAAPLDALTVLTTKGPLATKRITAVQDGPPKIESYGRAQRFSFDEWDVSSFDEMAAALKALQRRERSFVVRGKPVEGIDRSKNSPRRIYAARHDEPATLMPQPRYWLAFDMDLGAVPGRHRPDFRARCGRRACRRAAARGISRCLGLLVHSRAATASSPASASGFGSGSTGRSRMMKSRSGSRRRSPRR